MTLSFVNLVFRSSALPQANFDTAPVPNVFVLTQCLYFKWIREIIWNLFDLLPHFFSDPTYQNAIVGFSITVSLFEKLG